MKESNLSKQFLPKWQQKNGKDSHLFRNNTGSAYQGIIEKKYSKTNSKGITENFILLKNTRFIDFGIGILKKIRNKFRPVGGGDYIGWTSKNLCLIINGLHDNGLATCYIKDQHFDCDNCFINKNPIAIFTSLEFKTKNVSETQDQKDWKALVLKSGGIAEVVKEGE